MCVPIVESRSATDGRDRGQKWNLEALLLFYLFLRHNTQMIDQARCGVTIGTLRSRSGISLVLFDPRCGVTKFPEGFHYGIPNKEYFLRIFEGRLCMLFDSYTNIFKHCYIMACNTLDTQGKRYRFCRLDQRSFSTSSRLPVTASISIETLEGIDDVLQVV